MAVPLIFASIGASLIGSVLDGVGGKQQADAQAQADRENAALLRTRALEVLQEGTRQGGQVRMAGSKAISGQKVAFAAGGVDPSSGTAANLAGESRMLSELDALTLKNNAAKEARGLKVQAGQLEAHAAAERNAGNWALAGSLIGGAGKAAGMAYGSGLFGKVGKLGKIA